VCASSPHTQTFSPTGFVSTFAVTPNLKSYTGTKLLLGRDVSLIDLDDPLPKDLYGDGFLDLPKNKTAQDVCDDFLRKLHQYVVVKLEKEVSPEVLQGIPMDFWFTLPVVWSDEALKVFKDTAKAAGLALDLSTL
jgi:hypothetical protein